MCGRHFQRELNQPSVRDIRTYKQFTLKISSTCWELRVLLYLGELLIYLFIYSTHIYDVNLALAYFSMMFASLAWTSVHFEALLIISRNGDSVHSFP